MSAIFISYRRGDSAGYAGRLHESLERRLGAGVVFRDVVALEPGQDFVDAIAARLQQCDVCLVLIGREWLDATDGSGRRRLAMDDDHLRMEIVTALSRPGLRVVPVLVEGMTMPPADDLPASIRALTRRHAVSLRDETWDADVDRLVAAIRKAINGRGAARGDARWPWPRVWIAAVVVVLVVAAFVTRGLRPGHPPEESPRDDTGSAAGALPDPEAPALAIAVPPVAEVAHEDLVYTLLSGDVRARGGGQELRLRIRLSNERSSDANFWDSSFRLAIPGGVLEPTGGLNEVVPNQSVRQGVVRFVLPAGATEATLRISAEPAMGELPLDLTSTGAPSIVDTLDTGDVLSRAIVARVAADARDIGAAGGLHYTLVSAVARRFANAIRVIVTIRMRNPGLYSAPFDSNAVRILADGQPTAPWRGPSEVVEAASSETADFVFDLPPTTREVLLRLMGTRSPDVRLNLPDNIR